VLPPMSRPQQDFAHRDRLRELPSEAFLQVSPWSIRSPLTPPDKAQRRDGALRNRLRMMYLLSRGRADRGRWRWETTATDRHRCVMVVPVTMAVIMNQAMRVGKPAPARTAAGQ